LAHAQKNWIEAACAAESASIEHFSAWMMKHEDDDRYNAAKTAYEEALNVKSAMWNKADKALYAAKFEKPAKCEWDVDSITQQYYYAERFRKESDGCLKFSVDELDVIEDAGKVPTSCKLDPKRMSQYKQLAAAANAVSMLSPPTPEEIAAEEEEDEPPYIEDDEEEEEEEEEDNDEDREITGELDEAEQDGQPDEWWLRPLPTPHGIEPSPSPSPLAKKESKAAAKASPAPSLSPSPSPSPSPVALGPGKCGCTVSELVNQLVDTPIPKLSAVINGVWPHKDSMTVSKITKNAITTRTLHTVDAMKNLNQTEVNAVVVELLGPTLGAKKEEVKGKSKKNTRKDGARGVKGEGGEAVDKFLWAEYVFKYSVGATSYCIVSIVTIDLTKGSKFAPLLKH